jgi:hypothetical protein
MCSMALQEGFMSLMFFRGLINIKEAVSKIYINH